MVYPVRVRGARLRRRTAPLAGERQESRALVLGAQAVAAVGVAVLAALPVLTGAQPWFLKPIALVCAAGLVAGHLAWFARGRVRRPWLALTVQAVLGFGPLLALGEPWSTAGGFFAGGLLLVSPPARAVPWALLACVVAGVVSALPGWPAGLLDAGVGSAVSAGVAALSLFGLATAARVVAGRAEEVCELKRRTIAEERMRFSRDLHDLLGLSLSAITLKGELVDRMVPGKPELAKAELAELLVMSRRALADVRTIAAGYRELSLEEECRAAADVLSAAGTRVTVARSGIGELPPPVATTLGTVLREGVTNVVRHSTASWCAFSVSTEDGTAWLEIVNDGAGGAGGGGAGSGAGLRNLGDRVAAMNGTLTTEVGQDGTHRLLVAIPVGSVRRERPKAS
ncbi:histidine kinase [Amycolatopsis sp. FBCC-B4732]|uniref:sensor histidine kinase n=1 Tax=Amycolatopsis sp. FBCC-B4732 TaxID=3079339 RepID=UPI001FF48E66|nr:histidine kinase [Amycolatopsis sp. FBCC-B4732]UOX89459.1 histidine kinase [Amycolatopsis sp. FBCC-B4732]